MSGLERLLGRLFPLMALAGLLLAGWGLITTPEELRAVRELRAYSNSPVLIEESESSPSVELARAPLVDAELQASIF